MSGTSEAFADAQQSVQSLMNLATAADYLDHTQAEADISPDTRSPPPQSSDLYDNLEYDGSHFLSKPGLSTQSGKRLVIGELARS